MTQTETEPKHELAKVSVGADDKGYQLNSIEAVYRFGDAVVKSRMYPHIQQATQVVVISQIARDTGIPLSQALQNICFINNKAYLWGDGLISAAYATGRMADFKEEVAGKGDEMTATCTVKRKDIPTPFIRTFSMADAKAAKLTAKDPWQKYPKRMLQMRARAWALRDAGLVQGLSSAEEAMDMNGSGHAISEDLNKPAPVTVSDPLLDIIDAEPIPEQTPAERQQAVSDANANLDALGFDDAADAQAESPEPTPPATAAEPPPDLSVEARSADLVSHFVQELGAAGLSAKEIRDIGMEIGKHTKELLPEDRERLVAAYGAALSAVRSK